MWKRTIAGVFGVCAVGCGIIGCAYSMLALSDVGQIGIPIWAALLGNALLWLLTLGALAVGVDFVKFAFSGKPFRVPPRLRAISVGVLSFFPGFVFSLLPAAFYVSPRYPNDQLEPIVAFAVSAAVGLASVLTVSIFMMKRTNRVGQ